MLRFECRDAYYASVLVWGYFEPYSMPYILALLVKLFLEIKLFTFRNHENKSQITVD